MTSTIAVSTSWMVDNAATGPELPRRLGLLDATNIVVGTMIGSAIFLVPNTIAQNIPSVPVMLLIWLLAGVLSFFGALAYAELGAMMPATGGQYVYLREALGPLSGFLYGWTMFLVIQTGTIAAVAVAFAKFLGVFLPSIAADHYLIGAGKFGLNTQQVVAIALIVFLTLVNTRGVRTGALVQNVFTFAKVAALLGLIAMGVFFGRNPAAVQRNFSNFWEHADWTFTTIRLIGVAMVGSLFSSDAWNNVTFTAGEVRNPRRNLPVSLALGVGLVSLLYITSNFVYLSVLPLEQIKTAPEDRVATAVAAMILGPAAVQVMAAAIMVSTFGCANGLILAGARVYYAMALDRLFFRSVSKLDPVHHAPVVSLVIQCIWACLLTLSGRYNDLLDYVIFAVLLFYIMTIAGLFVLRRKRPDMERPYRAFGYPVLPALYIAAATLIEILLLIYKPNYTWPGLIIVLLGIPVYLFWRRGATASTS